MKQLSEEADTFLKEIEKILFQLNKALRFAEKWKAAKVNLEIDMKIENLAKNHTKTTKIRPHKEYGKEAMLMETYYMDSGMPLPRYYSLSQFLLD